MAEFTYVPETEIVRPNITIVRQYADGVHVAYHLRPNEGYVMYNPNNDSTVEVFDPESGDFVYDEDGNIVTTTQRYYYRFASIVANRPENINDWYATLESEVPADSIFGGGNKPEIM